MNHFSVAVDGPAGAGKSTLARAAAERLGFIYVDTGAIYRYGFRMMAMAMPAGATTSILALKYGADAPFASACTALTTVLSLLAVPLWCVFLL